jgi:RNA polymerase sigma-70 factor (ECF subfamily)
MVRADPPRSEQEKLMELTLSRIPVDPVRSPVDWLRDSALAMTRPWFRALAARLGGLLFNERGPVETVVTEDDCLAWITEVAKRRDRNAFEQLFRYYAPRLQSYMVRVGMGREAAEDLVQETLAEVWRKAALYRADIAGVSTWIFTIARNRRIDRLRGMRYAEVPLDAGRYEEHAEEVDYVRTADACGLIERMGLLPEEQQQVIRLAYLEGLSHTEIGTRLDLPLGTVKSRLRLAFGKLRELVGTP